MNKTHQNWPWVSLTVGDDNTVEEFMYVHLENNGEKRGEMQKIILRNYVYFVLSPIFKTKDVYCVC